MVCDKHTAVSTESCPYCQLLKMEEYLTDLEAHVETLPCFCAAGPDAPCPRHWQGQIAAS